MGVQEVRVPVSRTDEHIVPGESIFKNSCLLDVSSEGAFSEVELEVKKGVLHTSDTLLPPVQVLDIVEVLFAWRIFEQCVFPDP